MVLFLSHTAPGVQLCFYPHFCICITYRSLLLRLPWRTWLCPSEDQAWRWYSCLDHGDLGSTRYTGEPVATDAGVYGAVRVVFFFFFPCLWHFCLNEERTLS